MTFGKNMTIFKILALVLILACFIMLFLPWITVTSLYVNGNYNVFSTNCDGQASSFWAVMLVIFAILYIMVMLLGVFGILVDRSTLALPLAALAFLMFFLAVFQTLYAKPVITSYNTMMSMRNAGYNNGYNPYLFGAKVHVGAGAWLFFFLNLIAVGMLLLDNYSAHRPLLNFADFNFSGVSMPKVNLGGSWNCPRCGAVLGGSQRFCVQCGTPRPEAPRCPGCGKLIKPGTAFCPGCGTPLR